MQKLIRITQLGTRTFLRKTPIYSFAVADNKRILNNWEIDINAQVQMNNALIGAHSCKMFAELLRDNFMYMNDISISYAMKRIYDLDLDLDTHFYNIMVPLLRDYVSRFTREHNRALAEIVTYCAYLNVQDDQLWEILEKKLVGERLYRYIPLDNFVELVRGISQSQYGSADLLKAAEGVFVKHRLALTAEQCEQCAEAFKQKSYQSPILYKVLANPTIDIEAELKSQQKKLN